MFTQMTGSSQVTVRQGFTDADTYGHGFCFAAMGALDAPDYMPQGSVRVHNTMKQSPSLSIAHRDTFADCRPVGACHDGAEPATRWLPKE